VTETVIVIFDEPRDVYVDGLRTSVTNQRFAVLAGMHTFWLSGDGYRPPSITETISGTAADAPFVVAFARDEPTGDGDAVG